MALSSNYWWQTVKNFQIDRQITEIWPTNIKMSEGVSLWHISTYREADLIMIVFEELVVMIVATISFKNGEHFSCYLQEAFLITINGYLLQ